MYLTNYAMLPNLVDLAIIEMGFYTLWTRDLHNLNSALLFLLCFYLFPRCMIDTIECSCIIWYQVVLLSNIWFGYVFGVAI